MRASASLLSAVLLVSGAGVATAGPAKGPELIDVDVLHRAPAKPGAGASAANCSNAGTESGTYAFTGWQVGGARTARLATGSVPSYLGSVTQAMQAAFDVWPAAEPAAPRITVATGGTVTKPTANRSYDLMFGRTSGKALAVTYTWRWSDGFVESDTIFSTGVTWFQAAAEGDGCDETAGARYDVQNIAAHEFGHTYGFDHPSGARFETMYAYGYSGETLKRSLGSGDAAGARARY